MMKLEPLVLLTMETLLFAPLTMELFWKRLIVFNICLVNGGYIYVLNII